MRTFIACAAAALVTVANPGHAQDAGAPSGNPVAAQPPAERPSTSIADMARDGAAPNGRAGFMGSNFQLRATTDSSDASVTLSSTSDNKAGFGETSFALTFKAPVDKDTGSGMLLTQDGVPGDFGGEVTISRLSGRSANIDYTTASYYAYLAKNECLSQAKAKDPNDSGKACDGLVRTTLWKYLTKDQQAGYNRSLGTDEKGFFSTDLFYLSATGALGVRDFTVFGPATLAKSDTRKVDYSASISFGYLPRNTSWYLGASFEYRQRWKGADETTRCPSPPPPGPSVGCTTGAFAPPTRDTDYKLSGFVRHAFFLGENVPIGVELKASYDFKDNVVGVEAPIYFVIDDKSKLRGGVKVGWDSDKKRARFGVFVAKPFNLGE